MNPIDYIVSYCNDVSDFFYSIYLEVLGWVYPFWYAADFFYSLSTIFSDIAWSFYYFSQWVEDVVTQLEDILSWDTIKSYITSWLLYIGDLSTIFYYFVSNVSDVITNWWADATTIVKGWIKDASDILSGLIDDLSSWLTSLQTAWDSFKDKIPSIDAILSWWGDWWGNIMANLDSWWDDRLLDISALIDSAFLSREPFWAGWQDWKDAVIEFVQDPWQWFYDRLEELFERFW